MSKRSAPTLSPLFTWRAELSRCSSGLSPNARHIALVMSLHMSEKGDSCFPSVPTLACESGRAQSTVRAGIAELVEKGWLTKKKGGGRHSNRYTARIPETPPTTGGVTPAMVGGHHYADRCPAHSESEGTPRTAVPEDVIESDIQQQDLDLDGSRSCIICGLPAAPHYVAGQFWCDAHLEKSR